MATGSKNDIPVALQLGTFEKRRADWGGTDVSFESVADDMDCRGIFGELPDNRWYGYSVGKWADDTTFVVNTMGLLGELSVEPSLFEPFRRTPGLREIRACLRKQLTHRPLTM